MADPTEPTLPELAQSGTADEYRQVRQGGKTVADVVQARAETPEASSPGESVAEPETSAADTRARDETGRFITPAEGKPAAGDPRKDPGAKKTKIQDEINALSRQKGETQRERDAIAAEIVALKAERDVLKPAPKPAAQADEFPDFPEYEEWSAIPGHEGRSYTIYGRAAAKFDRDNERKAEQRERDEAKAQADHEREWKPYHDRRAEFAAKHPDFEALTDRLKTLNPDPVVLQAIAKSEHGPALQYYLAQHVDEAKELCGLDAVAAVRKVDALITSLSAASAVTTDAIPQTQADAPFETVGAAPTASSRSVEHVAAVGSARDFRRAREAQLGGRR